MHIDTLNRIAEMALQANKANVLAEHTPALVLDNKVVSIEHLQEGRSRFRGKFNTTVLSEYVSYLKANPGGVGFIDPKKCAASTFINLGDKKAPGHADWVAKLDLEPTAAYAALLGIEGVPQSQRALAEWIEDWAAVITAEKDGEAMSLSLATTAIRNISIDAKKSVTSEDRDFGATKSALEEIEARAKGGMPTRLILRASPYPGFCEREFHLRTAIITGDKPHITLRIVGKEAQAEDIAAEFKALLLEYVDDAATMTLGSFQP